jgi:hypothetical protein
MKLINVLFFGPVLVLAALSVSAYANEGGEPDEHAACTQDAQKFCGGVQPGEGRMWDCMKQHQSELSPDCQKHMAQKKERMEAMKQKMEATKKACQADLDKFCKAVTQGQGREMACLHAYDDKVSSGCKDVMMAMHHHHEGMMMTPPPVSNGQASQTGGGVMGGPGMNAPQGNQ